MSGADDSAGKATVNSAGRPATNRKPPAGSDDRDRLHRLRASLAARAEVLDEQRREDDACLLVAPLFTGLDPAHTEADTALADAALIHVQSIADDHDHDADEAWMIYALDTNRRLRSPTHPRTLDATGILAAYYQRHSEYLWAGGLWHSVIGGNLRLRRHSRASQARLNLAICCHALGRCGQATGLARRTWNFWCALRDRDPMDGADIAIAHIRMLQLCGRSAEALLARHDADTRLRPEHGALLALAAVMCQDPLIRAVHEPVCTLTDRDPPMPTTSR